MHASLSALLVVSNHISAKRTPKLSLQCYAYSNYYVAFVYGCVAVFDYNLQSTNISMIVYARVNPSRNYASAKNDSIQTKLPLQRQKVSPSS